MRYGLIAARLGHSFSAEVHRMIGGYDYELTELPESELPAFFARRPFEGINVTMPYKQTVIPYLDEISPSAASIGAVNTIVNRGGRLCGYNTDLGGMLAMLGRTDIPIAGGKVLILGTGGTARTARAAAEKLGAAEILLVSRRDQSGAVTYKNALSHHNDADVIINTTPVGMFPEGDCCPLPLSAFPHLRGVADAVYNPLRTRLVQEARMRGIPAQGGLYMLVAQAALAAEIFTGRRVPAASVEDTYTTLLRGKQNIVLIGMPGSGKTTVGRAIARRLGRTFADLDEMIEADAGKPIREIFRTCGEDAFRRLESDAVKEVSNRHGLVIATGGGCVLRRENAVRLRQNGLLILLDRPTEQLSPSPDRPLADTAQKLEALCRQRMPIYRDAADVIIETQTDEAETAEAVIKRLNEVKML